MMYLRKRDPEIAIQFDGTNLETIQKYLKDDCGMIQQWIDGMLRIDTEHGRLTVRKAEVITRDIIGSYAVYAPRAFEQIFFEVE